MPAAQAHPSQSAVAHMPSNAQAAQAGWVRYHFYSSGVLSSKLSVTRDDKKSVVFDVKMRAAQAFSRKPNVELRRMDGSLVGTCLVHGNCVRGFEVVFYPDEKCTTPIASQHNDSFVVPGMNIQLTWKNTSSNGGSFLGVSRKLVDNANNILAVYHSSVSLSKKGSAEIVSGLQPYLFDFIMLATIGEVRKREMEQHERSRHNQERRNHMNHHHDGHHHGNHRHHHC
ncbi:hypothetical protein AAVH_12496 [Aphelenchoides avenae]|nr:hypothetical protein AAVH_12496 [Aphelenchus avenae]